jgi:hypothetical protein
MKNADAPRMTRLSIILSRPRRALAALATVLVAVGLTGASGADFTSQTANPSNVFTAGTLSMDNSKDNAAIFTASNLRPGDPATTGTVEIENTGSLSAPFTLSKGVVSHSDNAFPLEDVLNFTVVDCGDFSSGTPSCGDGDDVDIFTGGTLDEMGSVAHPIAALGTFAAGERHLYEFGVALDSSADDNYQGDSSTARFVWDATS